MSLKISNQDGMTLLEVMTALVILCLLTVTLLSLFSASSMWIAGAGRQSRAGEYASGVIELVRAYADDIDPAELPLNLEDTDTTDDKFAFRLDPSDISSVPLEINAPAQMKAILNIKQHNDNVYYDAGFNRTIRNNLFDIKVTIVWNEAGHNRQQELSTIVSGR